MVQRRQQQRQREEPDGGARILAGRLQGAGAPRPDDKQHEPEELQESERWADVAEAKARRRPAHARVDSRQPSTPHHLQAPPQYGLVNLDKGEERQGERPCHQVRKGGREERIVHDGRRGDRERRRERAGGFRKLWHKQDERCQRADCKVEQQEAPHEETAAAPPQRQKQGAITPLRQRPAARRVRLGDEQDRGGMDAEVAVVGA
ncbi:MAG: hypothetical protein CL844_06485 [Crocinitomicaceae bacterium]|nr:hypothetical protein [Crocinitomicaceae bacterium]